MRVQSAASDAQEAWLSNRCGNVTFASHVQRGRGPFLVINCVFFMTFGQSRIITASALIFSLMAELISET
jgi:hypothetical protein